MSIQLVEVSVQGPQGPTGLTGGGNSYIVNLVADMLLLPDIEKADIVVVTDESEFILNGMYTAKVPAPGSINDWEHPNRWGSISGALANQSDLQVVLDAKGDLSSLGTIPMAIGYLPSQDQDIAVKKTIDDAVAGVPIGDLVSSGSVPMGVGYVPAGTQDIATLKTVNDAVALGPQGNLTSNGLVSMDSNYNPQDPDDIATVQFVNDTATGTTKSFIVDTVADMLLLVGVSIADRAFVVADPTPDNNGEYLATTDNPTLLSEWAAQSLDTAWGSVIGTLTDQPDLADRFNLVEADTASAKDVTDFITVTQAVDLDAMEVTGSTNESDITTLEGRSTSIEAKTDFITVTQPVNLDTMELGIVNAVSDITDIKLKTDFISVTQSVDLDTIEADTSANSISAVRIPLKVEWSGLWVDGTYIVNEMVRDDRWTMIANKTTTDRPSPQPVGAPERDTENAVFAEISAPLEVVKVSHTYTMTQAGWMTGVYIKVPTYSSNLISKVVATNETSGQSIIIPNPVLADGEWTLVRADSSITEIGDVIRIDLTTYDSDVTQGISGNWLSSISPTSGTAASGGIIINDPSNATSIKYSYVDLQGNNLTSQLNGVQEGSIIHIAESGDGSRYLECEVASIDTSPAEGVVFTIITLDDNKGIRDGVQLSVTIDTPVLTATMFFEEVGFRPSNNPSWATVTSSLFYNEVDQFVTDSAFGIDLQFQEGAVSPDWDIVALTASSVPAAVGGADNSASFETVTSTTTLVTVEDIVLVDATSGTITLTLPPAINTSHIFHIKRIDSSGNSVIITSDNFIDEQTVVGLNALENLTLVSNGTTYYIL